MDWNRWRITNLARHAPWDPSKHPRNPLGMFKSAGMGDWSNDPEPWRKNHERLADQAESPDFRNALQLYFSEPDEDGDSAGAEGADTVELFEAAAFAASEVGGEGARQRMEDLLNGPAFEEEAQLYALTHWNDGGQAALNALPEMIARAARETAKYPPRRI